MITLDPKEDGIVVTVDGKPVATIDTDEADTSIRELVAALVSDPPSWAAAPAPIPEDIRTMEERIAAWTARRVASVAKVQP